MNLAISQIQGLQKSKTKLPTWHTTKRIIFPPNLNLQQSSSEITAQYKANLLQGKTSIDLTGGFGVDSYYIANQTEKHTYLEPNIELFDISKHNFEVLEQNNITCKNQSTEEFIKENTSKFDCIYLDPSRRKEGKQVFRLEDYSPNIIEQQEDLFSVSDVILIKTSPILDIKSTLKTLNFVKEVHIVSVKNEVKEVLYLLGKGFESEPDIICSNIQKEKTEVFTFLFSNEIETNSSFSEPLNYLYEPNSSILKAGGFKLIGTFFNLKKLNSNTHLYTSEDKIDFQGRIFTIEQQLKYDPKKLKKLVNGKANINVRNFPYSVQEIRKKTGIKDGGDIFIFGITDIQNKPLILVCKKC